MEKVFASIITIGDELLIGQVVDTNSAWMAQELNNNGIIVKHRVAVGDNWDDIWQALDDESKRSSFVLITGGLGPTADDITKSLLCKYFDGNMVVHEPTLARIKTLFAKLNRPMIESNSKQAEVPDVCTVLVNERGTAPGMLFKKDGKIFVSMPGVPHEMKWIMENHVIPMIPQLFETGFIEHQTMLVAGIGESFLAELIKQEEAALPAHIRLAYLPNGGMVRLRLTGFGNDKETLKEEVGKHFAIIRDKVSEYLVTDKDMPLELVVGQLLRDRKQRVATAESCTGGYIAHLLTQHAGSSEWFTGSVVSYDNIIKEKMLGVTHETLQTVGAVSEATVTQMARSVLSLMGTDFAIAVSGIMGPGGATAEKPVGMVWIAVAGKNKLETRVFNFRYERKRNIEMTAVNALNMLRAFIVDNG